MHDRRARCCALGTAICTALAAAPAGAACLLDDYSVGAEAARSKYVLVVEVESQRDVPDAEDRELTAGTWYRVRAQQVFRGKPAKTFEVYSENSSGRFPMEVGKAYLVFVGPDWNARLSVDPCGNSGLLTEKQDLVRSVETLPR